MSRKFDLAALMGAPDVSKLDTQEAEVVQLPITAIAANDANFYKVDDVTDLKESIEVVGLQQPLVVMPDGDGYRLIAGHRRLKALTELGRANAPCIVRRDLNETQEQLALILTNSTARELSYPEKMEQAKQLKELFCKRREEGAELPGRIRDMVAEAMQESASNIARMEAIDKHLAAPLKKDMRAGKINASAAYELSKLEPQLQKQLYDACKNSYATPTAALVKAAGEIAESYPFAPLVCPKSGKPCTRYKERAPLVEAGTCPGCCNKCDHQEGCAQLCGLCKQALAARMEGDQRREAAEQADAVYMQSAYRQAQLCILEWAKDTRLDDADALPRDISSIVGMLRSISTPVRRSWMPALQDLFGLADLLDIPLAALLGLAPEPPPYTVAWHAYPEDKPQNGEMVLCSHGGKYNLLIYQDDKFGVMVDGEFVDIPFKVTFWTDAYPEY